MLALAGIFSAFAKNVPQGLQTRIFVHGNRNGVCGGISKSWMSIFHDVQVDHCCSGTHCGIIPFPCTRPTVRATCEILDCSRSSSLSPRCTSQIRQLSSGQAGSPPLGTSIEGHADRTRLSDAGDGLGGSKLATSYVFSDSVDELSASEGEASAFVDGYSGSEDGFSWDGVQAINTEIGELVDDMVLMPSQPTESFDSAEASTTQAHGIPVPMHPFEEMGELTSWEEVMCTLEKGVIHPVRVETAWHVLRKLPERPPDDCLDRMASYTTQIVGQMNERNFAGVFNAMARMSYVNPILCDTLAGEILKTCSATQFSPRNLSNVLHDIGILQRRAWATLQNRPKVDTWRPPQAPNAASSAFSLQLQLFDTLARELPQRLNELNHIDLARALYGIGVTQYDDKRVLKVLAHEVENESSMTKFGQAELVHLVFGLTRGGIQLAEWCPNLLSEINRQGRLEKFTRHETNFLLWCMVSPRPQEGANVLPLVKAMTSGDWLGEMDQVQTRRAVYAIGKLNVTDFKIWKTVCDKFSTKGGLDGWGVFDLSLLWYSIGNAKIRHVELQKSLAAKLLSGRRYQHLTPLGISNVFYGVGHLRFRHRILVSALVKECGQPHRLPLFSDLQLSNIIHSLGLLRLKVSLDVQPLMGEFCRPERLARVSNVLLVNVLFGTAVLGKGDVQAAIAEALRPERLREMDEFKLGSLVFAVVHLGTKDHCVLQPLFDEIGKPERLPHYGALELARTLHSMGKVNWQDSKLTDTLVTTLMAPEANKIRDLKENALGDLLLGLGSMGYSNQQAIDSIVAEAMDKDRLSMYSDYGCRRVLEGITLLRCGTKENVEAALTELHRRGRLGSLGNQSLAHLALLLGGKKQCDPQLLEALVAVLCRPGRMQEHGTLSLVSVFYSLGMLGYHNTETLATLTSELVESWRIQQMEDRHVLMILRGMHLTKFRDAASVEKLMLAFTRPQRLSRCESCDLANIVYSLALLAYWQGLVSSMLLDEVVRPGRLSSFTNMEIGTVLYSLGRLKHKDPEAVGALLNELIQRHRSESLSGLDVANGLYALSRTKYENSEVAKSLVSAAARLTRQGGFDDSDLVRTLVAMSDIKEVSEAMMGAVLELVPAERLQGLTTILAVRLLWALSHSRKSNEGLLGAVVKECCTISRLESATEQDLLMMRRALDAANWQDTEARMSLEREVHRREGGSRQEILGTLGQNEPCQQMM